MSVLTKLDTAFYDRAAFADFTTAPTFTLGTAKALMWLSQLAYETDEPAKVATLLAAWELAPIEDGIVSTPTMSPLPVARTEAVLASRREATMLAFAGTDPLVLADWVADFDIRPHLGGSTEGFSRALEAAMPAIRRLLAPAVGPVFVTGHSLGGALAVLAAFELAKDGVDIAGVYTYGMPRPAGAEFTAVYEGRLGAQTFRMVHGRADRSPIDARLPARRTAAPLRTLGPF